MYSRHQSIFVRIFFHCHSNLVHGRRSFRVCCPATWNALPTELRTATVCLYTFSKQLKTCLFESAYWEHISTLLFCLFCAIKMRILIDWLILKPNILIVLNIHNSAVHSCTLLGLINSREPDTQSTVIAYSNVSLKNFAEKKRLIIACLLINEYGCSMVLLQQHESEWVKFYVPLDI